MKVIVLSEDQTKRIVEDMNQKFQDDGKKKKAVHLKHNLIVIEGEDDFMFFDVYENEGAIVLSEFQWLRTQPQQPVMMVYRPSQPVGTL